MRIKPIKTETDYHAALKEIERIFDAAPGTREGDRLDRWCHYHNREAGYRQNIFFLRHFLGRSLGKVRPLASTPKSTKSLANAMAQL
jgi:hypothetical protein